MSGRKDEFASYMRSMLDAAKQVEIAPDPDATRSRSENWGSKLAELANRTFTGVPDDEDPGGDDSAESQFDRGVRVIAEVDGRGRLLRVEISPFAMRDLDTDDLAAACTEAIRLARTEAAAEMEAAMAEFRPPVRGPELPSFGPEDFDEVVDAAKEVSEEWTTRTLGR